MSDIIVKSEIRLSSMEDEGSTSTGTVTFRSASAPNLQETSIVRSISTNVCVGSEDLNERDDGIRSIASVKEEEEAAAIPHSPKSTKSLSTKKKPVKMGLYERSLRRRNSSSDDETGPVTVKRPISERLTTNVTATHTRNEVLREEIANRDNEERQKAMHRVSERNLELAEQAKQRTTTSRKPVIPPKTEEEPTPVKYTSRMPSYLNTVMTFRKEQNIQISPRVKTKREWRE